MITVKPKHAGQVEREVRKLKDVRVLQAVSGAFDLMALAVTDSITDMDELIDAIGELDGVERTTSIHRAVHQVPALKAHLVDDLRRARELAA